MVRWMTTPQAVGFVGVVIGLAACSGGDRAGDGVATGHLAPGVVARVGSERLEGGFVASVATKLGVSAERARQYAMRDALFAEAARSRFRDSGLLEVARRSAHSRALLDALSERAKREGPPTEAELKKIQAERWMDFDRPVAVATAHALVRGSDRERARALAERIAQATAGARDAEPFMARARQVSAGDLDVVVEQLPFIAPDGRAVYLDPSDPRRLRADSFDPAFAKAAHAIGEKGDQSGVVETSFGHHVILLLDRVAAQRYTLEELGMRLEQDVYDERARRLLAELAERLQGSSRIELAPNWQELTERASKRP